MLLELTARFENGIGGSQTFQNGARFVASQGIFSTEHP
jgi:hypothetical protein